MTGPSHVQAYLENRKSDCTTETLKTYLTLIRKVGRLANKTYNLKTNLTADIVVPLGREQSCRANISMIQSDYNKLHQTMVNSNSTAKTAIELAWRFGLRVSETTKLQGRDIKINSNMNEVKLAIIDSKGARSRELIIKSKDDIEYLKNLKKIYGNGSMRIVPIKCDSVNKYLSRALESAGLGIRYKNARTGIHSIRKAYAQKEYDRLRSMGITKNEALSKVSVLLGHGERRPELMQKYIERID